MPFKPVLLPFGKTILQTNQGQPITSDNVYLTDLIRKREDKERMTAADLGCGSGILSIMLAYYRPFWKITGFEIQKHLADLASSNSTAAETNNVTVINQDIRIWTGKEKYDLLFSNPPYYRSSSGKISPVREKAISRHEITCTMLDILRFIQKFLKPSGKAYLIYPLERCDDMRKYAKKVDLNIEAEFSFNKIKKEKVIFLLSQRKKIC